MVARARINSRSRDTHLELNVPLVKLPGIRSNRGLSACVDVETGRLIRLDRYVLQGMIHSFLDDDLIAAVIGDAVEE